MGTITAIKPQQRNQQRVSIFVDKTYSFSLSIAQWEEAGLKVGDQLKNEQVEDYKKLSATGKLFDRALAYIARRPRSEWEMATYLKRKEADETQIEAIVLKLKEYRYLDDQAFAESWVRSRRATKPTSYRQLRQELFAKRVPKQTIDHVLAEDETTDNDELQKLIAKKRSHTRYQNREKFTAFLVRKGFSYRDVKQELDKVFSVQ